MTQYTDFYQKSLQQPDVFWQEQSLLVDWKDSPVQICDYSIPQGDGFIF